MDVGMSVSDSTLSPEIDPLHRGVKVTPLARAIRASGTGGQTITIRFSRSNRTSIGIALRCAKRYQLLPGRRAHNSPLAPDVVSASAAPSVQALQRAAHTRIALPIATRGSAYEARAKKAQRTRGHEDGRARGSNSTKTSESPCTMRVCGLCSFFSLEARILASRFDSSHLAAQ
jgi:hypothetical protein